ncbi:hypothetical protein D3C71_1442020 [compost metagenome]
MPLHGCGVASPRQDRRACPTSRLRKSAIFSKRSTKTKSLTCSTRAAPSARTPALIPFMSMPHRLGPPKKQAVWMCCGSRCPLLILSSNRKPFKPCSSNSLGGCKHCMAMAVLVLCCPRRNGTVISLRKPSRRSRPAALMWGHQYSPPWCSSPTRSRRCLG